MDFGILGPLCVTSGDRSVDLGPPAQRVLLAVLLTSPCQPVTNDRLIEELWGDDPPPSARHVLHVYVSRLRSLLAEPTQQRRVVRTGSGYAIELAAGELDAQRFSIAVEEGRERVARDDLEAADRVLAAAMALWRGTPFADLEDPPQLVREQAAQLERIRREAIGRWIDVRMRLGKHEDLVSELSGLASAQPYDETLHANLMLALYRCHRQADALATGRALRKRLRDDLGIDPSPEVRDLYRDILLQAPHLVLDPPEPPSNLPGQLTSFLGRVAELEEVTELVHGNRLVTLSGPAGIGKTRLAIEVARNERAAFPGGILWVDLATVTESELVADELARVVGLSAKPGSDLTEGIVTALRRRQALLLIDNCEHVAAATADLVTAMLAATSGPHILATSRIPLSVDGEVLWKTPPLGLPPDDTSSGGRASSDVLREADSVRLFVERGRRALPSFALDPRNSASVAELCRRLDGLPLAIEMAAARLSTLSPTEIAAHLDERFDLLESRAVTGRLGRHRSLEAAIDASMALLSEPDRDVFERLSVFLGPFGLEAVASVACAGSAPAQVVATVGRLVDASLLTPVRDSEETRYRLLETLREYGAAHLRDRGLEGDARLAHADYHLGLAARAAAAIDTPGFASWVTLLGSLYPDVRLALGWSLAHQDRAVTLRGAWGLAEFWYRRGEAREAARWGERMLEGDVADVPGGLLAGAHHAAGFAATMGSDAPSAIKHGEAEVRLSRDAGFSLGVRKGLLALALDLTSADFDVGGRAASEALEVCDAQGQRLGRAGPLAALAQTLMLRGRLDEARQLFQEALPLFRELGDVGSLVIFALLPLSSIALRHRDLETAERYATEALELSSGTGWQAPALVLYGEALAAREDLDAASVVARRALPLALEAGYENWFRVTLRDLGCLAARQGQAERAAVLLGASRRNMPLYGLDPEIYGPAEAQCRRTLGDARFAQFVEQGSAMTSDALLDYVEPR